MFRFRPSVESLEAREVPSGVSGRVTGIAVDPADPAAATARHFNGFVSRFPAGDDVVVDGRIITTPQRTDASNQGWGQWEVNLSKLPAGTASGDAGRHVRHRMFAIVDRTQLSDGVVLLASSLPGGGADSRDGERVVLTGPVEFEASRPSPDDGAITFYGEDGSVVAVALAAFDPSGGAADGSSQNASHRPTILLHRLANPDLPNSPTTRSNVFAVWLTVGFTDIGPGSDTAEGARRRNQVTLLSADLDRPGVAPDPHTFTNDPRGSGL